MKEKKVKFVAHEGGDEMNLLEAMDYVAEIVDVKSEEGLNFLRDKMEDAANCAIEYHDFSKKLTRSEGKSAIAVVGVFLMFIALWVFKLFGVELLGGATELVLGILSLIIIAISAFNIGLVYAISRVKKESDMYQAYANLCMAVILKNEMLNEKKAHKKAKKETPKKEDKDGKGKARKA